MIVNSTIKRAKVGLSVLSLLLLSYYLYFLQNSNKIKIPNQLNVVSCLEQYPNVSLVLKSIYQDISLDYIENSPLNCKNPYFPSIHIIAKDSHSGWIQIVHTDSKDYGSFLDTIPSIFPFYTREQNFYDAPMWNYSLFHKPLSTWTAHAYAVQIDDKNKRIICIGGIEWGFKLNYFNVYPQMIKPTTLSLENWNKDGESLIKTGFHGYQNALKE